MAFLQMDLYSHSLTRVTEVAVVIPEKKLTGERLPVLWLLHGGAGNFSGWWRFSAVERYAEDYGCAVVMPSADQSFYSNINTGRYFDLIAGELPQKLCAMFPLSCDRANNFIAGASMGGYGSYKFGLMCPEKYSAVCAMSAGSILDFGWDGNSARMDKDHKLYLGTEDPEDLRGTEFDLHDLAEKAVNSEETLPKFYADCGTEDPAYNGAKKTFEVMKGLGLDISWYENSGMHNYAYWDHALERFLEWLTEQTLL